MERKKAKTKGILKDTISEKGKLIVPNCTSEWAKWLPCLYQLAALWKL